MSPKNPKKKIKIRTFDSLVHIPLVRKMGQEKARVLDYTSDVCYANDILVAILDNEECVSWIAVTRGKQVLFVYDYEVPSDLFERVMGEFFDVFKTKVKHMRRYIDIMVHSDELELIECLKKWDFRAVAIHSNDEGEQTEDGYLFRYRPLSYAHKHPEIPEWYGTVTTFEDIAEISKG